MSTVASQPDVLSPPSNKVLQAVRAFREKYFDTPLSEEERSLFHLIAQTGEAPPEPFGASKGPSLGRLTRRVHAFVLVRERSHGRWTGRYYIEAYVPPVRRRVERLRPNQKRSRTVRGLRPDEINGVRVEFIPKAPAVAWGAPPPPRGGERVRPLVCGVSISSAKTDPGTLGLFARSRRAGEKNKTLVLSYSHVLTVPYNDMVIGDPIYQASPRDGGQDSDRVASLLRRCELVPGMTASLAGQVDAAVAEIKGDLDYRPVIHAVGHSIAGPHAFPPGADPKEERYEVCKFGRTTGWSKGRVSRLGVEAAFSYRWANNTREVVSFSNLIRVVMPKKERKRSFAHRGDSGAALLTQGSDGRLFAIGMIVGGDEGGSYALAAPLADVEAALDIDVIYAR